MHFKSNNKFIVKPNHCFEGAKVEFMTNKGILDFYVEYYNYCVFLEYCH